MVRGVVDELSPLLESLAAHCALVRPVFTVNLGVALQLPASRRLELLTNLQPTVVLKCNILNGIHENVSVNY